ncbi:hypothetical protein ILUMI_09092 [Ignelater luminosus]|uniref:Uncharacterized protein n=1 Tax=Ignelater luminosus TaxID=2038154 RepID=A0A8K0D0F1_IGNLU|nr:hypothetical protein ILUMI_09092 [Ignelater luminosus]
MVCLVDYCLGWKDYYSIESIIQRQKSARVDWCQCWCRYMLSKFDNGSSKGVFDVVTGDESWIYQLDPELKRQFRVWV